MPIKLGELYRMAVKLGMDRDIRSKDDMAADLRRMEERYRKLDGKDRERFDLDSLWNPYADSRLLFGDPEKELNGVLWGIDITPAEILLADRLREK
ncbi:MAG TPA: NGG1p interacting factor NIF3, partial [Methanomassiliicoccales archaeon]|nr:NGG1p interacting factor NIF3 [Methanomassiliicoccales archaeon]